MLPALLQLLLVALAVAITVAVAAWGISIDRSEIPPTPSDPLLVAGGRQLYRIPTHNTHRAHGRHRAQ
ncbi:hypothetical protein HLB23_16565 [Nocardia uniformis]|uniref:Uncharacterized protein n=1 Tax=Nocardia uniformis TaxID=53432 RepID=A0A849C1S9_9NOCA|nr:hypothetical protein [Nocardia uniformis]NNH71456.1 hypothetical protein [Nocardia uniformis]